MTDFNDEDALIENWHETKLRVRYSETDKMGVVYHANFLVWFEIGRTEFCRARGFSYRDMEENADAYLVVAESYCRYKAPARYDDELIVRTHITEQRRRSLRFSYEIVRVSDDLTIAEGETSHVVTDSRGRVRSFPPEYNALFAPSIIDEATYSTPQSSKRVPEDSAPD